jgi:hypothetical protein
MMLPHQFDSKFIYGKPPHANISDAMRNPAFMIISALDKGKPPALRPANCAGDLWDFFEVCWSIDPDMRPDAVAACQFLEENREQLVTDLEK